MDSDIYCKQMVLKSCESSNAVIKMKREAFKQKTNSDNSFLYNTKVIESIMST